jgi:hypothetical protein
MTYAHPPPHPSCVYAPRGLVQAHLLLIYALPNVCTPLLTHACPYPLDVIEACIQPSNVAATMDKVTPILLS